MRIIEQSYSRLEIRFGNAILPVAIFIGALILGLAIAVYSSAADSTPLLILGALIMFAGLVHLAWEQYVTLTFDRFTNTLDIVKRRALVPNSASFDLRDVRGVEAVCSGNVSVNNTPPGTKTRCTLIIDVIDLPDYEVKRNLKRDDAAQAVGLIRQFLDWDES
jgi:hypothetical protein